MPSRAFTSSPSSESREPLPSLTLTRRDFLRTTGVAVATLGLISLRLAHESDAQVAVSGQSSSASPGLPDYRTWEDLYREQWCWDRVARGTHSTTNCVIPSPFKPTTLAGDYGHLHWAPGHWEPNQVDRDTRVEVERI